MKLIPIPVTNSENRPVPPKAEFFSSGLRQYIFISSHANGEPFY